MVSVNNKETHKNRFNGFYLLLGFAFLISEIQVSGFCQKVILNFNLLTFNKKCKHFLKWSNFSTIWAN